MAVNPEISVKPARGATMWKALLLFVSVRAIVLLVLWALASVRDRSVRLVFVRWDAQWYRRIAEHGYGFTASTSDGRHLSDYAFFPAQPLIERLIHFLTGLSALDAGIVISAVSSVIAAAGIYQIARAIYDEKVAFYSTFLWAAIPIGIVESMSYSESLFTALAAWSLYFTLRRNWVVAAALASFASFTRPVGLAVCLAVIISLLIEIRSQRILAKPSHLFAIFLAPSGWILYLGYVSIKVKSFSGYFAIESRWGNGFDAGAHFLKWCVHLLFSKSVFSGIAVLIAVGLLIWLLVICFQQNQPVPLLVFATALVAIALTTSGYFGSKPRYLLPGFPLLFPIARVIERQSTVRKILAVISLTIVAGVYGAYWLLGNGPP